MEMTLCPEPDCMRGFLMDAAAEDDWSLLDDHVVEVHGYADYAVSTKARASFKAKSQTMPDGSFPIPNVAYLKKAIKAFGRASEDKKAAVKAWIKRRARALGATQLIPQGW